MKYQKLSRCLEWKKQPEQELIKGRADKLQGLKVVDRIQLPVEKEKKKDAPVASSDTQKDKAKSPRKRISSLTISKANKTRVNQVVAKGPSTSATAATRKCPASPCSEGRTNRKRNSRSDPGNACQTQRWK